MINTNAKIRFEKGHAKETIALSLFGFLKYLEFTGTGLHQPNQIIKIIIVQIGSKCRKGFKETLHIFLAVSSHNHLAVMAWENSCIVNANKKLGISMFKDI